MLNRSNRPVDWIEKIVERDGDRLFRIAIAITGSKAEAEDAVQDVFVKLLEKQPFFESSEHETAWLVRVTVNTCKNRIRSFWWKMTEPLLDIYPARSSNETEVMEAVMSLSPKYRLVIHLYYYEGYSAKEIAEITLQTESTVRQKLTRARQKLRKFMEGEMYERLQILHGQSKT